MAPPPRRPARRPFSARGAPPGEPCGGPRPPRRVGGRRARVSGAQRPREGPTAPCERNGRPRRGTAATDHRETESTRRPRPPRRPPCRGGERGDAQEVPRRSLATPFGHASCKEVASTENRRDWSCAPDGRNGRPRRAPAPTAPAPGDVAPRSAPKPRPPRPPPCRGGGCGDAQEVPRPLGHPVRTGVAPLGFKRVYPSRLAVHLR